MLDKHNIIRQAMSNTLLLSISLNHPFTLEEKKKKANEQEVMQCQLNSLIYLERGNRINDR